MRPDSSHHLVAAAKRRHELARSKAIQAIRELERAGNVPITFESVARTAKVSRSWIYTQPDLREEIQRLRTATAATRTPAAPDPQRASAESLRRRLATIQERNRQLAEENQRLRHELAISLGQQRTAPSRSHGSDHSSVTIPPF